ncbi:unnamed protein product [Oikopleura dioica]|uniref:J domain-containing protein n=1 Tax=Oikopleura dioica TaxID=34765 RepID=E4X3X0_OIKDI|nr:unnamed protein product [Oikopleura dioica]
MLRKCINRARISLPRVHCRFMNEATALRILELDPSPSKDDIKKAYKNKSRIIHPDMPTGDEAKFQELHEAYEVLEELRARPYSRAAAGRSSESPHVAAHREAQRKAAEELNTAREGGIRIIFVLTLIFAGVHFMKNNYQYQTEKIRQELRNDIEFFAKKRGISPNEALYEYMNYYNAYLSRKDGEKFLRKLDYDDVFDLDERYKNLDGYYQKRLFNPPWKF